MKFIIENMEELQLFLAKYPEAGRVNLSNIKEIEEATIKHPRTVGNTWMISDYEVRHLGENCLLPPFQELIIFGRRKTFLIIMNNAALIWRTP